jgi:hypothetical protein
MEDKMMGNKGGSRRPASKELVSEWARRIMVLVVGVDNVEVGAIPRTV